MVSGAQHGALDRAIMGEAMPEQVRSAERPSEPASGLTALLALNFITEYSRNHRPPLVTNIGNIVSYR